MIPRKQEVIKYKACNILEIGGGAIYLLFDSHSPAIETFIVQAFFSNGIYVITYPLHVCQPLSMCAGWPSKIDQRINISNILPCSIALKEFQRGL